jgi:hypothetical protein
MGSKRRTWLRFTTTLLALPNATPMGIGSPTGRSQPNMKYVSDFYFYALAYCSQKSSGDFPTVLYEVVSARSSVTQGSLTVDELNEVLDDLSKNHKNS